MIGSSAAVQDAFDIGLAQSDSQAAEIVDLSTFDQSRAGGALLNLLRHLQDGVCLFDADQRLVVCNDQYARIYNLPVQLTRPGTTLNEVLASRIAANNMPKMEAEAYIANRQKAVSDAIDHQEVHQMRDGRVLCVRHKPLPDGGWLTTHTDITEIYDLKKEIEHMAFHDQLTGLANRRRVETHLRDCLERLEQGQFLALTFIDLDGFKAVNDTHGHSAGDEALQIVGKRIQAAFGEGDVVARIGGDEFAIVQWGETAEHLFKLRTLHVVNSVSQPVATLSGSVQLGASVGVVHTQRPGVKPFDLWKQADAAMYVAKRDGGSRSIIHPYS